MKENDRNFIQIDVLFIFNYTSIKPTGYDIAYKLTQNLSLKLNLPPNLQPYSPLPVHNRWKMFTLNHIVWSHQD